MENEFLCKVILKKEVWIHLLSITNFDCNITLFDLNPQEVEITDIYSIPFDSGSFFEFYYKGKLMTVSESDIEEVTSGFLI